MVWPHEVRYPLCTLVSSNEKSPVRQTERGIFLAAFAQATLNLLQLIRRA